MNGLATIGEREAGTPLPRLYLRPDEAAHVIGVSRRTLSAWQSARVIGLRRVGRTILFSVADIQTAIDRYRIAPIGEPHSRRQPVETGTITAPVPAAGSEPPTRKQRMQRIAPEPTTPPTASA
jgi:excisionase family DNA binding protein